METTTHAFPPPSNNGDKSPERQRTVSTLSSSYSYQEAAVGSSDDDEASNDEAMDLEQVLPVLEEQEPVKSKPSSCSCCSYLFSKDLIELLVCVLFFIGTSLVSKLGLEPHERPIPYQYLSVTGEYVRDGVHNHLFDGTETVPERTRMLLTAVLPILLQLLLSKTRGGHRGDAHATGCVYLVTIGLTTAVTETLKLYVGYLRPNFYQYCQPDDTYQNCTGGGDGIRKSFPSGHASQSFCGMMLLTLYIHNRFGVPSVRQLQAIRTKSGAMQLRVEYTNSPWLPRMVSLLSLLPLYGALMIAASRIVDNKHHPADVVAGSLLGAAIGAFCHFLWY